MEAKGNGIYKGENCLRQVFIVLTLGGSDSEIVFN